MRPVWLEGSRAGSLEDLGESRVTVSGTMKVLNKFHFLSSLPLHLVMACSGLCVWGLGWDVPGCLEGAVQDFAKRKEGEKIQSHRKLEQRSSPRDKPQQGSHPGMTPWPSVLSIQS